MMSDKVIEDPVVKNLPPKKEKLFWIGTKLPSMGCMITVFSFFGFKEDLKCLLYQLNSSGRSFYEKHLTSAFTIIDTKSAFRHASYKYLKAQVSLVSFDVSTMRRI